MIVFPAVYQAATQKRSHAIPQTVDLPSARVTKLNADGSYLIEISGQKFRALTGKQLDDLAKMEIDLKGARQLNENLTADNLELEKEKASLTNQKAQLEIKFNASEQKVQSLGSDLQQSRLETKRYSDLLTEEVKARKESTQFIPHSSIKGFWGKLLTTLDRPEVQATFKVGIPLLQTVRCN